MKRISYPLGDVQNKTANHQPKHHRSGDSQSPDPVAPNTPVSQMTQVCREDRTDPC